MKITIADGRASFYQWDVDRKLRLEGVEPEQLVQFGRPDGCAYSVLTFEENGEIFAHVPNAWLQNAGCFPVYVRCEDTYTTCKHNFCIQERPKPDDYVYTEDEHLTWQQLDERIKELETHGTGQSGNFIVTVTDDVDKTFAEMTEAYDAGRTLVCNYGGALYSLYLITSEVVEFHCYDPQIGLLKKVLIFSDNSVLTPEMYVSVSSVNGKTGAVNLDIPDDDHINSLIDNKLSQFSNAEGVSF